MYDSEAFQAVRARLLESGGVFNAPRVRKDSLFGRLIRADTPLLTDDLAYELSIGRSTLVSDLKRLRTELTPYRLSILGKTRKGLVPEGRESDIWQYLLERAYNALYQDYPLDHEILELVEKAFAGSSLSSSCMADILDLIGNRDFPANVISKSGTTMEPAAFRIFKAFSRQGWRSAMAKRGPGNASMPPPAKPGARCASWRSPRAARPSWRLTTSGDVSSASAPRAFSLWRQAAWTLSR